LGSIHLLGTDIPDGLIVKADVALQQLAAETEAAAPGSNVRAEDTEHGSASVGTLGGSGEPMKKTTKPSRFHGSAPLEANRVGRDAGRIADEVLSHLAGLVGADVKVTLEIEATVPNGFPDDVVRIVTQNARDLKFSTQGFEE
jgi:hypothetical protein